MTKPTKKLPLEPMYNYDECREWLEQKYGYKERDYAEMRAAVPLDHDKPYWDFWHFVLDNEEVKNGCEITMGFDWACGAEDWQVEILNRYLKHFGEGEGDERTATFWVEW